MRINFTLLFYCITITTIAQDKFQISAGVSQSFLPNNKLRSGEIGLVHVKDRAVHLSFSKKIKTVKQLYWGVRGKLNLFSGWYELDRSIPYYVKREHIPIFTFESVELYGFLKKIFLVSKGLKTDVNLALSAGPAFIFAEGNSTWGRHGLRDDTGNSYQISRIDVKVQPVYQPFIRGALGIEIIRRLNDKWSIGIMPFVAFAAFTADKHEFITLPDDSQYRSTGNFKRNRNEYGISFIVSK